MKKAIIIGINGQDGSYLAELLLEKGYQVNGWVRPGRIHSLDNINHLVGQITLSEIDLTDSSQIEENIAKIHPSEIYNLAAPSKPHESWKQALLAGEITGLSVTRLLEAILKIDKKIRFYQASSSEMFGTPNTSPQSEDTPFAPRNPYGVSKLYAHWVTKNYQKYHGLFSVSGILFNHESPRRGLDFVTRKITHTAAMIKLGMENELRLGDLEARRDWGYAPDFVKAIWMMLQQDDPESMVIGTGETRSVREFCDYAFACLGLDYRKYVIQDERFMRPKETVQLVANPAKAKGILNWTPEVHFKKLVEIMVVADLKSLEKKYNLAPVRCCI